MWAKIKKALAWAGGIIAIICGVLFASRNKDKEAVDEVKEALEKARKQVEEDKKKLEDTQKKIEEVRKQTDGEVEHAKDVEVPTEPDAVADALNDVLARARGSKSGSTGKQNCNGCTGRH